MLSHANQRRAGQAATELAVFGAVLVFLIGGIVRNGVANSNEQNTQLKVMRLALLQSYRGSVVAPNQLPKTARTNSSVIYFEDRLSPEISRYGNTDRVPNISFGGGTLSNLLYYPLEGEELINAEAGGNLPIVDLYVNGIHLPLTAAKVVTKNLNPPVGFQSSYTGSPVAILPAALNGKTRLKGWDFKCVTINTPPVNPVPASQTFYGCPLFYNIASGPKAVGVYGDLTEDEAFDLNRNDDFSDDPKAAASPGKVGRAQMAWHWKAVKAINLKIDPETGTDTKFDLDGDGQVETIYTFTADANKIITSVMVMDNQDGDFDSSVESVHGRAPGLQPDMSILTQTYDGTTFVVKEGKLYNPETGKYARSVSFKDQVELVQRMFQLTSNTGRFCDGNGNTRVTLPDGSPNPVEACGNSGGVSDNVVGPGGVITSGCNRPSTCFDGDNIKLTCFDTDTWVLYLRSRVLDRTGHAWLSNTAGALP